MTEFPATARRMLALEAAGAGPFLLQTDCRIAGGVDAPGMAAAIASLAERHEALRTVADRDGARVRQRILREVPDPPVVRVGGGAPELVAAIQAVGAGQAARIAAGTAPLFAAAVLQQIDGEVVVVSTAHHAVVDGYSILLMLREALTLYAGAPLARTTLQYRDFARQEQQYLASAQASRCRAFWRAQIESLRPPPRPSAPPAASGVLFDVVDSTLLAAIEAAARRRRVGVPALLLAAASGGMSRASGSRVGVGLPVANRSFPGGRGLVGLLCHSLPLVVDVPPDAAIAHRVEICARALAAAYRHSRIPLAHLIERFFPDEYLSPHELVPLQLNFFPVPSLDGGPLLVEPLFHRPIATAAMDGLNLFLARRDGTLLVSLGYGGSTSQSDASTFLHEFKRGLESVLADL